MRVSDQGLVTLAAHEGVVPAPYLDAVGVWTFGIGHTAAAGKPDPATMPKGMPVDFEAGIRQAFDVFRDDLPKYEAAVKKAVKVALAPHEFDALVSFHFNTGAIGRASFVRKLNAGDRRGAADGMLVWNRAGGKVLPALTKRREEERAMFLRGEYPANPIAVWRVNAGNRPVFSKAVRTLTPREALALMRPSNPPGPRTPEALHDTPEAPRVGFLAWLFNLLRGR